MVNIGLSLLGGATHRYSSTTYSPIVHSCGVGRVDERGASVHSCCAKWLHNRFIILNMVYLPRSSGSILGAYPYSLPSYVTLLRRPDKQSISVTPSVFSKGSLRFPVMSRLRDSVHNECIIHIAETIPHVLALYECFTGARMVALTCPSLALATPSDVRRHVPWITTCKLTHRHPHESHGIARTCSRVLS